MWKRRPLAWSCTPSLPIPGPVPHCEGPCLLVYRLLWLQCSHFIHSPLQQLPLGTTSELRTQSLLPTAWWTPRNSDPTERPVCGSGFKAVWAGIWGSRYLKYGEAWAPSGCSHSVLHYHCPAGRNAVGGGTQQAFQKWSPSKAQSACSAPLNATRIGSGKMPEKKHLRKWACISPPKTF